ncbi:MAG: hypothetical protein R3C40_07730 [Parvularculaceae bacterium]
MNDFGDLCVDQQLLYQGPIRDVGDNEFAGALRHFATAGRQIVDGDRRFSGPLQRDEHMCADITGAACYQHCHRVPPRLREFAICAAPTAASNSGKD